MGLNDESMDPSAGKSSDERKPGMQGSRIPLFLAILFVVICIFTGICLFIGFIFSGVFSLSGHHFNNVYYMAGGIGLFTLGFQIIAHIYHRWPMFPFYLLSSICIGVILYGFLSSLAAGLVLLVATALSIDTNSVHFTMPLEIFLVGGTLLPVLYGLIDARFLRVRRLELRLHRLKGRTVKIVFISDLHLGLLVGKRRIDRILSVLRDERPDMIAIGGDLYDTRPRNITHLNALLSEFSEIAPTYAVTGNHEFINGVDECVSSMEDLGMTVLRNRMVVDEGTGLQILGVDDSSGQSAFAPERYELSDFAGDLDGDRPSVFLNHAPLDFQKAADLGIGLELSGHTHGGQLWPIGNVTKLIYRAGDRGLHRRSNSYLHVSKGGGTWGPPMRVGASPEMTILKLTPWSNERKNK